MAYYQLDSEKLEPGDVILEAGTGIISQGIKLIDAGLLNTLGIGDAPAFSHVFLYVGMNLIMEADEDVRSLLASRVITEHPENFLVLRHPEFRQALTKPEWKLITGNMAFFAMHPEVNKPYNWRGMFATKVSFLPGGKNGFFCSQLVTEAYKRLDVRPFASDVTPEKATPNMFVTADCLLRPVAESCFIELPKRAWISELLEGRYTVMKAEPVPIAQLSHKMSQDMVRLFGPRVDQLTKRIGQKQAITSPMDLYLTLSFPDLPEADEVSDDLVSFMEHRYPKKQIESFIALSKASIEQAIAWKDPDVIEAIRRMLRKDIATIEQFLPAVEQQPAIIDAMLRPPMRKRSIHRWLNSQTDASAKVEREFLAWRKEMLQKLSAH